VSVQQLSVKKVQRKLIQSFVYTHNIAVSGIDVVDILQIVDAKWDEHQAEEAGKKAYCSCDNPGQESRLILQHRLYLLTFAVSDSDRAIFEDGCLHHSRLSGHHGDLCSFLGHRI